MQDMKVTIASLRSILKDTHKNLKLVEGVGVIAQKNNARILFLPELMLTGHGGHAKMTDNAEPIPTGPLSSAILEMSNKYSLCICVGIAELSNNIVYNSQMVADKGRYLGLQRKITLSGDEYCHFGAGESVESFDIGDIRFGITICYDNLFPELALIHSLNNVDLILSPHAARSWKKPDKLTRKFCSQVIQRQQNSWEKVHKARAYDHNVYVLLCNAVGASTEGIKGVVANHAGSVMGVDPDGEVFLRTKKHDFTDEIVTVELRSSKRKKNHAPARNRRILSVINMINKATKTAGFSERSAAEPDRWPDKEREDHVQDRRTKQTL
jgi:predicted amidohydrolase